MKSSPLLLRRIPPSPRTASEMRNERRLRMKETGRMKLDELHVGDDRAGAPGHRHAVAGRDRGVGRVEINLAAAAGGEDETIGANRFHLAGFFIEHINAEAAILGRKAELAAVIRSTAM